jgi:hypothetical protein
MGETELAAQIKVNAEAEKAGAVVAVVGDGEFYPFIWNRHEQLTKHG